MHSFILELKYLNNKKSIYNNQTKNKQIIKKLFKELKLNYVR